MTPAMMVLVWMPGVPMRMKPLSPAAIERVVRGFCG